MDNLVSETNLRLQEVIDNLATIKKEYEKKLKANDKQINSELAKVKKYKKDFFEAKEKVEKMNADIVGFSEDYKKLVERFKDDELANILIAANKEISLKIEERKRKIIKDKASMNELVEKAEKVKESLVVLTQEKNALESCYVKICDAEEYYRRSLNEIIDYSNENKDNLCAYFDDANAIIESAKEEEPLVNLDDMNIEENETEEDTNLNEESNSGELTPEEDLDEETTPVEDESNKDTDDKKQEFDDEEFILSEHDDDIASKDEQKEENEEFTFEEVPSDLDDIDSTLEGIFNTNDSLTDDTSIYNKDEEN